MLTKGDLGKIGELLDTKLDTKIEELAISIARGFEEAKENLKDAETRLTVRIDHIEYGLIREHGNRIEKLEDNMRIIKTDLGLH